MTLDPFGLRPYRNWVGACVLLAGMGVGVDANAEGIMPFDNSWKEQDFLHLFANEYALRGAQLDVLADGAVSLLWRPVDDEMRNASSAKWTWRVREDVIPTDLTVKGNDDRNLAVYFVFVDPDTLEASKGRNAARILRERSVRALIYRRNLSVSSPGLSLPSSKRSTPMLPVILDAALWIESRARWA